MQQPIDTYILNNAFRGKIGDDLRLLFKTLAYMSICILYCHSIIRTLRRAQRMVIRVNTPK